MDQKVKGLLEKIGVDEEFQGKLIQAKSPEEALQVVQDAGFDFGMDEFKSLMQQVLLYSKQETGQELTDEELAMVAGGWDTSCSNLIIGLISAFTPVIISAAMAAI